MSLDGEDCSWLDARHAAQGRLPAVLPFGSFEQHGPHLPLTTDTDMALGLARRVAVAIDGFLLPAVAYGETCASDGFPGTLSLSFDTVRSIVLDICSGLQRGGFPCLVVVNGESGNQAPLRVAAREVLSRLNWPTLIINYPGLAEVAARVCESPVSESGISHADELETSVMMALRPMAVREAAIVAEYPVVSMHFGSVPPQMHELSVSGVIGDARLASAEKGELILSALADRAVEVAKEFLAEVLG